MKKLFGLIALCAILTFSQCGDDDSSLTTFTQHADEVLGFSSEYDTDDFSASQLLGPPDLYPTHDDDYRAWAPETTQAGRQYLVLGFDTIQTVSKIEVYETYTPGAIDTVYLRNASTKAWNKVYTGTSTVVSTTEARIFTVDLPKETSYFVDALRIALNTDHTNEWIEIDAVALTGKRKK